MSARNQAITQQIKQDWINREYIEISVVGHKSRYYNLSTFYGAPTALWKLAMSIWRDHIIKCGDVITSNIKRIAEFLNSFDMSCRSKLSQLNEKLTMLERRIEYLEARVTKGETLN